MPNAYAVVWCNHGGGRHVLLATKKFLGVRFGGLPAVATLLNGAGQACFPGGDIHMGETPAVAAHREFHEETGIDLSAAINIANYHVQHNHVIAGVGFSTLYIQVAGIADLNALSVAVNNNIANNTPLDDELANVQVVAEANVAGMLGVNPAVPGPLPATWYNPARMPQLAGAFQLHDGVAWRQIGAGFVAPPLRALVTGKLTSPWNWHTTSVNNLAAAALAAAAVAPVPVAPVWNLGLGRRQQLYLSLVVVGLAYSAMQLINYLYPERQ